MLWFTLEEPAPDFAGVWSVSYPGAVDWQLSFPRSRFPPETPTFTWSHTPRAAPCSLALLRACPGLWWSTNCKWLHCCGLWAKLPLSKVELQLNSLLKSSSRLDLWTLFRATSIIAYVYKLFRNAPFIQTLLAWFLSLIIHFPTYLRLERLGLKHFCHHRFVEFP